MIPTFGNPHGFCLVKKLDKGLFLIPSLTGAAGLLFATSPGIGVYSDSVMYVLTARSLLKRNGWTIYGDPVTVFPPLYPLLLALPGIFGVDPLDGARWLQAAFFAGNILWAGLLTYYLGRSVPAALVGSLVMCAAVDLTRYTALALSDGAFLFFWLPSFLLIMLYLDSGKSFYLFSSALLSALSTLTRYAGIAWIISGTLTLLLFGRRARVRSALWFLCLSIVPYFLWIARNARLGTAMGRSFDVHAFFGPQEFASLLHTFSGWLFQWVFPDSTLILIPVIFGAAGFARWFLRSNHRIPNTNAWYSMMIFALSYGGVLIASAMFFQADLFRDSSRLLMPLHALFIIAVMVVLDEWARSPETPRARLAGTILFSGIVLFFVSTWIPYIISLSGDGQGYASRAFRSSPLIQRIGMTDPAVTIYSNLNLPVSLYTKRRMNPIPLKINNGTQRPSVKFDAEMRAMASDVRDSSALVAYFSQRNKGLVFATLDEVSRYVPLRLVDEEADGGLYEAADSTQ